MTARTAIVLGAGVQGCCAAFALANNGWTVKILERSPRPVNGASLRGEGKLHLGYVYANDPSHQTADLMSRAALSFSMLLDSWLPSPTNWAALRSQPFRYGILRESMLAPNQLLAHYADLDDTIAETLASGGAYAGLTQCRPVREVVDPQRHGFGTTVAALVETDEVAINPALMRELLVRGLDELGVEVLGSAEVRGVDRCSQSFAVTAASPDATETVHRADIVVNCLWDGRLGIDATLGIAPDRPWSYRLKYGVHGRVRSGATPPPSVTFVLGPFGDVVHQSNGDIYASWYPDCVAGWSSDIEVPADWRPSILGTDSEQVQGDIAERTLRAMTIHVPSLADVEPVSAAAGVIVAWGQTDIDDRNSGLHQRSAIGVHDHDGYFSIDTGKFTCAPMFARDLLERVSR